MKKHKTNYPLSIILSTLSTLLPLGSGYYLFYAVTEHSAAITVSSILLIAALVQWAIFRQPLKSMYQQAVQDNEYDEFGISKKKKFENLTRKERETIDLQKAAQIEQLLSSSVLKRIIREGSKEHERELDSLIGLDSVKQKVAEMAARMKFEREIEKKNKKLHEKKKASSSYGANGRHFCFYGSAGTGKTTIARIIAGFLYKYGYIKENKCIEIDGNFLKAGDMSDTKTKLVIQKAYGGVLFIDEAYTIIDGNTNQGKAVIATLIKEMEDNRDKFTVIIAGYKKDMKRLIDTNEGFKSRIKEYLEFPDYDVDEMKEIFAVMAKSQGYDVSGEAMCKVEERCKKEKALPSFGNGRTVRNILDETIDRHAFNYGRNALSYKVDDKIYGNEESKFVICECDVSTEINLAVL